MAGARAAGGDDRRPVASVWAATLEKIRCPACGGRDHTVRLSGERPPGLDSGEAVCLTCGATAPIIDGMLDFRSTLGPDLEQERCQWEVFAASEGWLEPPEEYLVTLPNPSVPVPRDTLNWHIHAWNFERMLEAVDVAGKRVLDVGAGRCWSTRLLAQRDARCTATDIMEHPTIGLGAAEALFRHYGIWFERILCDMVRMPFADEAFDVVWISGSLHHTTDLERTIRELARVLVPGGRLVLVNEACGGLRAREVCRPTGLQEGLNEHEYYTWRYLLYLRQNGFRQIRLMRDWALFHQAPRGRLERLFHRAGRRWPWAYTLKTLVWGKVLCLSATKR